MAILTKTGIIWDVETTGLDSLVDVPIEVGAVEFEWEEDECALNTNPRRPRIISMYGGLCDPGREISDEITGLTGITNADVKGKILNDGLLTEMAARASIHVAHNAKFDKGFVTRLPFFLGIPDSKWACTIRHIDWAAKKFKSNGLTYLAADHGFVNPFPHRALFDCATTFRLMEPHFEELLRNYQQKEFTVFAWDSAFATKDLLRERKYNWQAELRVWKKDILESMVEEEREFLNTRIYRTPSNRAEFAELSY